ncbi:sensor domain-containing protein, partial [Streptomyces sp. NPDC000188]
MTSLAASPRGPSYLRGSAPWRAAGYLAGGVLVGAPLLVTFVTLGVAGAVLSLVLVGLPLLALLSLAGVPVGALERRRLRPVTG